MIPTLLTFGPLPIYTFGLMVALAVMVAIPVLSRSFARAGLPPEYAERYALWGGIGGLIGARLWNLFEHRNEISGSLLGALVENAGFTFYGGFLTSTLLLTLLAYKDGIRVRDVFGSVGPALALGYALGRLGCQLSGDGDYGAVTNSWIGMSYETGVVPTPPGVRVYPTPFFESVAALGVWWILDRIERGVFIARPLFRGGMYLLLMSVERFFVEFYRIETRYAYGLSEAQYIALILSGVGITVILLDSLKKSQQETITPAV